MTASTAPLSAAGRELPKRWLAIDRDFRRIDLGSGWRRRALVA